MTQDELAKRVGVTKAYISLLESGGHDNPSLDVLRRLAEALGVPLTKLLK